MKNMKLRCYDIEYDLSEETDENAIDETTLPQEVIVEISKNDYDSGNVQVADLITDKTGFFICSHEHEVIGE